MNITLINFLLKLKNAYLAKKYNILVGYNKNILEFSKILYKEGLIQGFFINKQNKNIIIFLRHSQSFSPFHALKIISTVSNTKELKYADICKLSTQQRIFFFSTTKGIMTSMLCKQNCLGGKLLFIC